MIIENNVFTGIYTHITIAALKSVKVIIIIITFLTPSTPKSPYLLRLCFLVSFHDFQISTIIPDTVIVRFRFENDGTCQNDGGVRVCTVV